MRLRLAYLFCLGLFLNCSVCAQPHVSGWLRRMSASGSDGSWLWGWAWGGDNTVSIVDRTPAITFSSRPASFGPMLEDPLLGYVIPLSSFTIPCPTTIDSDADEVWSRNHHLGVNYGCPPLCPMGQEGPDSSKSWIALLQRGRCSFADKVREAQRLGAKGVVIGGSDPELTGVPDVLVNMYSPGPSSDINIPSTFVKYSDYAQLLSLISTSNTTHSGIRTLSLQISAEYSDWEWYSPILTFFVLLLLPSSMTVITLLVHRIRASRAAQRERAPEDIVNGLPWQVWTKKGWEKHEGTMPPEPRAAPISDDVESGNTLDLNKAVCEGDGSTSTSQGELEARAWFDMQTECAICISHFAVGDRVRVLPCKHIFHMDEIDEWLIHRKKLCPICKRDVTQPSTTSYVQSPRRLPATEHTPLLPQDTNS